MQPLDQLLAGYGLTPALPATPTDPSFSIVVRTQGRRPASLNEALDSISAQTYSNHETVVVVHGPDDVVTTVRDSIGERPQLKLIGVEGGGRSRPLNTGLDEAGGDLLCFLDDDDLVMPDWLTVFADASDRSPGSVIRAVTLSQPWATDGAEQPLRATGPVERPFPVAFDLLAHMSLNLTPICSLAFPTRAITALQLRFDESLPVFEDWDFLMRAAMALGVTSVADETSLYRRLDHGNADTVEGEEVWRATHAMVIDRLSSRPVLLPVGDARRLAGTHFEVGGRSRHETELAMAHTTIDSLTRSPLRWIRAFGSRAVAAIRHRIAARRP